jgi:hypothetical protein
MSDHLTEDQICRAVASQSTLDEHRHVQACAQCRTEIGRMHQVMVTLRHDIRRRAEREVLATTPSFLKRDVPAGMSRTFALAAASVTVVAAALVWQARATHSPASMPTPGAATPIDASLAHAGGAGASVDTIDAFYPLRYSAVPIVNGRIVRIEVPRSAPAAFGLDPVEFAGVRHGAVVADVLVGEDGLARAVRFVRPVVGNAQKE